MPFTETPTRNATQLTAFYEDHLKRPIETAPLRVPHVVRRSEHTFNITEQIIKDLYTADVVICDLSGVAANPNVMYELGIRLAVSNKPVILIREAHKDNRPIFDIGGFYAEQYDPLNYSLITVHVLAKLASYAEQRERYESPVLKILAQDEPLIRRLSKDRAAYLLQVLGSTVHGTTRVFSGSIYTFAKEHGDVDLGESATESLNRIQKNWDVLAALDWSTFHFRVGSQPAIDAYIANLYLAGLVEHEIEAAFTEAVIDYHVYFLSADTFWEHPDIPLLHQMLGESLLLVTLCSVLVKYLRAPDDLTREELRRTFTEVYEQRKI